MGWEMPASLANSERFDGLLTSSQNTVLATSDPPLLINENKSIGGNKTPVSIPPRAVRAGGKKLARRRYQKGSVLLLGSKTQPRWYGRFYVDTVENGETRRRHVQVFLGDFVVGKFDTEKLAMRELEKHLKPINDPNYHARPTTTFREFAEQWIEKCRVRKRKPIKPSVLYNWRRILDNHVLPVLGDWTLPEISNAAMKELVKVLDGKKLAAQTIKNVCLVVKLAMKSAVDEKTGDRLYPITWNAEFIDAPEVVQDEQHAPCFTGEQVSSIVKATSGQVQMLAILLGATGMRAGEILGLECKHFDGSSIKVEQEIWGGKVQKPKTRYSERVIDVSPDVCRLLKTFIGDRKAGFIFQTRTGRPLSQTNLLKRDIYPILEALEIPQCGFHAFRRFRNTYLRNRTACPAGLLKIWMGHSTKKDMSDRYDKIKDDVPFRREVAARCDIGFDLPSALTPKLGRSAAPFRTLIVRELETVGELSP